MELSVFKTRNEKMTSKKDNKKHTGAAAYKVTYHLRRVQEEVPSNVKVSYSKRVTRQRTERRKKEKTKRQETYGRNCLSATYLLCRVIAGRGAQQCGGEAVRGAK